MSCIRLGAIRNLHVLSASLFHNVPGQRKIRSWLLQLCRQERKFHVWIGLVIFACSWAANLILLSWNKKFLLLNLRCFTGSFLWGFPNKDFGEWSSSHETQEILLKHKKETKPFYWEGDPTLLQVAWRGHGLSIHENILNPVGHSPEQLG